MKKCGIHELSDYEKQNVADELMLPTGVFGAMLVAGLLCLALLWQPNVLFKPDVNPVAATNALRSEAPFNAAHNAPPPSANRPAIARTALRD